MRLRRLGHQDLVAINSVISEAVAGWPLPVRLIRLSLPLLVYDRVDLDHFSVMGAVQRVDEVDAGLLGIAAWDDEVLHGLYVRPEAQGRGIGRALLGAVRAHARAAGVQRLLVRAERVSAGFFHGQGLPAAGSDALYPHTFHLQTAVPP